MATGMAVVFADWPAGTAIGAWLVTDSHWWDLPTDTPESRVQPTMGIIEKAHPGLLNRNAIAGTQQHCQRMLQRAHSRSELQVSFRPPGKLCGEIALGQAA